jgi:hypothetical protein
MEAIKKLIAFYDIAPCSVVEVDRRFSGAYCHQGDDGGGTHRPEDGGSKHL